MKSENQCFLITEKADYDDFYQYGFVSIEFRALSSLLNSGEVALVSPTIHSIKLILLWQCLLTFPALCCAQSRFQPSINFEPLPSVVSPAQPESLVSGFPAPADRFGIHDTAVRQAGFQSDAITEGAFVVPDSLPEIGTSPILGNGVTSRRNGGFIDGQGVVQDDDSVVPVPNWLNQLKVGYDNGFLIVGKEAVDLNSSEDKFRLRINGWGQLRNTVLESETTEDDARQFQLKRARIVFSGSTFTPDFKYFVQIDGRSSDGDDLRLLDYYLQYDIGRHFLNLERSRLEFRTGRWKMPFHLARHLSGREFEFTDRSMGSMFFDVNRSLAWGLNGKERVGTTDVDWEFAIFNGLVTGGAETGSSGDLDSNFAYSSRVICTHSGEWGKGELADFDYHDTLALRTGAGIATSTIEREGFTEFRSARVVDSGRRLSELLPDSVDSYRVFLYSVDLSAKYRGWSFTNEYYFRTIDRFQGAALGQLFDHGHWMQIGKFIVPERWQIISRWSRVDGNSGTLGIADLSSDEVAGGIVYYFRDQHAKITFDATRINGSPVSSAALDVEPGISGWWYRTQIQFAF